MATRIRVRDRVLCALERQSHQCLGYPTAAHCRIYLWTSRGNTIWYTTQTTYLNGHMSKRLYFFYYKGFLWLNPDVLYSCSKDKMLIRQEIKTAYEPVKVLRRNGMGWNIQGDLAFAIDFSSRDQFVDERYGQVPSYMNRHEGGLIDPSTIPRPAASQTKKWKKLSKRWVEDEVRFLGRYAYAIFFFHLIYFEPNRSLSMSRQVNVWLATSRYSILRHSLFSLSTMRFQAIMY